MRKILITLIGLALPIIADAQATIGATKAEVETEFGKSISPVAKNVDAELYIHDSRFTMVVFDAGGIAQAFAEYKLNDESFTDSEASKADTYLPGGNYSWIPLPIAKIPNPDPAEMAVQAAWFTPFGNGMIIVMEVKYHYASSWPGVFTARAYATLAGSELLGQIQGDGLSKGFAAAPKTHI